MRDMFSAMGAEERDKKASELATKRERAEEDLLRTQIQLEQRQKKAKTFGQSDTVEARAARLSVTTTEAEAKRLKQSISDMDKELAQFASIATMRASDPGTTVGRIQSVAQNADARNFLLQNLAGEAVFKPLFEGLLTAGSEQQRKLAAAQGTITTDISVFEKALQTQDITPQQQIARDMQLSQALQNVESVADPQLEFARAIKEIRVNAEANNTLPRSMFLATSRLFETIASPILPDSLGTPQTEARFAIERLREIISEAEPVGGFRRAEDQRQAEMIREQIKVIERLEQLSRDMQANTEEVRRNNEILQQDVQTNNTGTIQAQVEKRK